MLNDYKKKKNILVLVIHLLKSDYSHTKKVCFRVSTCKEETHEI